MRKIGSIRLRPSAEKLADMTTEVKSAKEAREIPLELQGNDDLYSDKAVEERQKLRYHPRILKALEKFWDTAKASDERSALGGSVEDHISCVRKQAYVQMSMKLYKVCVEDWDEKEAYQNACNEWLEDTRETPDYLSREKFEDAIFGVADMWTGTVQVDEYESFLEELWSRVAKGDGPLTYRWKVDPQISFWDRQLTYDSDEESPPPPQRHAAAQQKKANPKDPRPNRRSRMPVPRGIVADLMKLPVPKMDSPKARQRPLSSEQISRWLPSAEKKRPPQKASSLQQNPFLLRMTGRRRW